MSETEDSSDGRLTDWAMVDNEGEIPDLDDDVSSTASSVEVLDDDDDTVPETVGKPSLAGAPGSKGPLFVLRLPNKNKSTTVSDTDEDQLLSEGTVSSTETQSNRPPSPMSSITENTELHSPDSGNFCSARRQVSQEEIDALCRTLDDIKDNLVTHHSSVVPADQFGEGTVNTEDGLNLSDLSTSTQESEISIDSSLSSGFTLVRPHTDCDPEGMESVPLAQGQPAENIASNTETADTQETDLEQETPDTVPVDETMDNLSSSTDQHTNGICTFISLVQEPPVKIGLGLVVVVGLVLVVVLPCPWLSRHDKGEPEMLAHGIRHCEKHQICGRGNKHTLLEDTALQRKLLEALSRSETLETDLNKVEREIQQKQDKLHQLKRISVNLYGQLKRAWIDTDALKLKGKNRNMKDELLALSSTDIEELKEIYGLDIMNTGTMEEIVSMMDEAEKMDLIYTLNSKIVDLLLVQWSERERYMAEMRQYKELQEKFETHMEITRNGKHDLMTWMKMAKDNMAGPVTSREEIAEEMVKEMKNTEFNCEQRNALYKSKIEEAKAENENTWDMLGSTLNTVEVLKRNLSQCKHMDAESDSEQQHLSSTSATKQQEYDFRKLSMLVKEMEMLHTQCKYDVDYANGEKEKLEQEIQEHKNEIKELKEYMNGGRTLLVDKIKTELRKLEGLAAMDEGAREIHDITRKLEEMKKQIKQLCAEEAECLKAEQSTEARWESCKALMAETYQKQYENINEGWTGIKDRMNELAESYLPQDMYELFKQHGVFESSQEERTPQKEPYDVSNSRDSGSQQNHDGFQQQYSSTTGTGNQQQEEVKQEGSGESTEEKNNPTFADSIFYVMNKTREQLQETWGKVKNMSDDLWKEHGPTLHHLSDSFSAKFHSLGEKFQHKLRKKMDKWFRKSQQKKGQKAAKTKRREFNNPDVSVVEKKIRKVGNKIERMAKFNKMHKLKKNEVVTDMQERLLDIHRSHSFFKEVKPKCRAWVECQSDWWDTHHVPEHCEPHLCCWQLDFMGVHRDQCQEKGREDCAIENCILSSPRKGRGKPDKEKHGRKMAGRGNRNNGKCSNNETPCRGREDGKLRGIRKQGDIEKPGRHQKLGKLRRERQDEMLSEYIDNKPSQNKIPKRNGKTGRDDPQIKDKTQKVHENRFDFPDDDGLNGPADKIPQGNTGGGLEKDIDKNVDYKTYTDDFNDEIYETVDDWYLVRAEEREYLHQEPDDWYFRRIRDKNGREPVLKHKDLDSGIDRGDDNWYIERMEDRHYKHQEPDDWYFRRYSKKETKKLYKKHMGYHNELDDDEDDPDVGYFDYE